MWRVLRLGVLPVALGLAALDTACGADSAIGVPYGSGSGGGVTVAGASSSSGTLTVGGGITLPPIGQCAGAIPVAPLTRWSIPDIDGTLDGLFGPGISLGSLVTIDDQGYQRDLSSAFISALRKVAAKRAQAVVSADETFQICDEGQDGPSCIEPWVRNWGERLYRRPLSAEQVIAYVAQFRGALAQSTPAESAQNVLISMILSPYFVFRVELGESGNGQQLSAFEVATRLSHFATRQSPDAELLASAAANALRDPAQLVVQLHRLWNKPEGGRARSLQHLELLGLSAKTLPTTLSAELRADMMVQTKAFLDDVFESQGGSLVSLLAARRQPLTPLLAAHYGMPAPAGDGVQFVDIDPNLAAGVLSEGAFLSTYPRPTLRGRAIVEKLQCQHIPDHPIVVDRSLGTEGSPRERIEQRTGTDPVCSGCHALIDPIGFALDAFDEQGRLTGFSTITTLPVSAQGTSAQVNVPNDLGSLIARSSATRACIAQRYLEAAIDRPISDLQFTAKIVLPPGGSSSAQLPVNTLDPDHQLIECVVLNASSNSNDLNLTRAAEVIVASGWLQSRAGAPKHFAAFDTSLDPVEHAYQEAAQFVGAFPDSSDNQTVQRYMDGLREVGRIDAWPGVTGDGGAGGDASAGAPSSGGAP